MGSSSPTQFVHRGNTDGAFVSFCRECIVTVGTAAFEDELADAEREHTCDPADLARIAQAKAGQSRGAPLDNPSTC